MGRWGPMRRIRDALDEQLACGVVSRAIGILAGLRQGAAQATQPRCEVRRRIRIGVVIRRLRAPCPARVTGATYNGCVRVNGDSVFVSTALAREIIGLKQETELSWRARDFDIDLGTIEILPINDAFCSETVIRTVNAIQATRGLRDLGSVSA